MNTPSDTPTPELSAGEQELAQASTSLVDTDTWVDPELAALCRGSAADGTVLLSNDGTLPLAARTRVALFSRVQVDYFTVGYGSGGDVNAPYSWNLLDALRDGGRVDVDAELADLYTQWSKDHQPDEGTWGNWPRYFDEMPLERETVRAAASRTDVAVVIIGRAAGEARENTLEPGSYYLTDDERTLLDSVTGEFERTVVILDCGNVIDLAWLEGYGEKISSVLYAWQGGMEGARAVADVLTGAQVPGGRLTDTIARHYEDYPSAPNFGGLEHNVYAEDIYVGYRYFETFAPEKVLFPFGFGLSYTTLEVAPTVETTDADVTVTATVTNTGSDHPGAEVVQVYVQAPDGLLGKPARSLVGFTKSSRLAPGESETVTVTVPVDSLASYDDAGVTGHRSAYVLEAGEYTVYVGTDVRTAAAVATVTVDATRVVQQLAEANAPEAEHAFQRMTVGRDADGQAVVAWQDVPTRQASRKDRIEARELHTVEQTGDQGITLADVAAGTATLDAFVAQLSDDELEALTRGDRVMGSELGVPGNAGVFAGISESLRAKGVPPVTTTDGPSGIRLSAYASLLPCGAALAATWNTPLVRRLAASHGQEMVRKGTHVLLSPGMNIHRDPLCGRNFEYFSEDPLVTGLVAAAVIGGVQEAGVAACPKHFAANNQETNRNLNDSRVSERALREIYLRGFQIAIAESAPRTIMTSYNKINGVWSHYNDELCTQVLRDEWGFEGTVVTDWWMQHATDPDFPAVTDDAYRVRAQVDVFMPGGWFDHVSGEFDQVAQASLLDSLARPDGIALGELQRTARTVLNLTLGLPVLRERVESLSAAGRQDA
ncbi:beta-glucosidase-like glycosyl hydrolase [Sanguibacter keddieii DSM 10542]|uniref:Beta-glucosidase-like glycosyl hydrolase n=1 Tax=Sanguibacter keddieii (strain ATCC 51767 / DSM 10542 / NCFB 3025 / ST-74) TaxID=446469 RepID=D1BHE8_SANKS|nr:glycoside hydrolase family 3 protein [Sanguibacter keddieii]ACZ21868.1 beta-glucosidase-like glycosyl hydrolase [Sanguibacter keddieii DSM 10542]